jgi:hypothetical protein
LRLRRFASVDLGPLRGPFFISVLSIRGNFPQIRMGTEQFELFLFVYDPRTFDKDKFIQDMDVHVM